MTRHEMITELDQEIHRLETARTLLRNSREVATGVSFSDDVSRPTVKRRISPEGRKRIIEAQRRRWAKQKKEVGAKGK